MPGKRVQFDRETWNAPGSARQGQHFQRGYEVFPFRLGTSIKGEQRILVHNNVAHSINATAGRNGFLAWAQAEPAPPELLQCNCGWAGLPTTETRATDDAGSIKSVNRIGTGRLSGDG